MFALVTDLIFSTKISSTAKTLGTQIAVVRTLEQLRERLASAADRVALIDLNSSDVNVLEAIAMCRSARRPPHVIAYGSHVQTQLLDAARKAGADEVMPRSAFANKLPAILMSALHREQFGGSAEE